VSETINWTFNVQVVGGPQIAVTRPVPVDAYDKIGVKVQDGETETVEIQPGDEGRVQFLLINSDWLGDALTYKVNAQGDAIKLDAPQVLVGDGAVGLLGEPPNSLEVTNDSTQEANIEIIVGRKATD
jgi:hypothetical protein